MIYTCYWHMADEAKKRLDRIAKKAAKYGIPFSYTVGEEYAKRVNVYAVDPADSHTQYLKTWYNVAAVDFDIDCDALVKNDGWTLCAKIEHGDKGNIVTSIGDAEIDPAWYTAKSRCDHCGTNRFRAVTFICRKNGEYKQVGRTCLKDYTGIAPEAAVMFAEVSDLFPGDEWEMEEREFAGSGVARMYDVTEVIAHACDAIAKHGYIKSEYQNSTKEQVFDALDGKADPTAESMTKAAVIVEWLKERGVKARADQKELDRLYHMAYDGDYDIRDERLHREYIAKRDRWDRVGDLERNCAVMAESGFAKANHIGMLAYIPIAYDKYMERKAREEQREAERAAQSVSAHVGNVGDRITINTATATLITSWETQYGWTYLYKFTDADNNVFVWFASRCVNVTDGATIKGTVKDHTERDGVKQTVLTRCKIA